MSAKVKNEIGEKETFAETVRAEGEISARPPPDPPRPESLADADMPPVETLKAGDDVSGFFSPRVSAALRKRALRTVFRQGRFNLRDGLDDYDEDYTVFPPLTEATAELRKLLADRQKANDAEAVSDSVSKTESKPETDSVPDAEAVSDSDFGSGGDSDSVAAAEATKTGPGLKPFGPAKPERSGPSGPEPFGPAEPERSGPAGPGAKTGESS